MDTTNSLQPIIALLLVIAGIYIMLSALFRRGAGVVMLFIALGVYVEMCPGDAIAMALWNAIAPLAVLLFVMWLIWALALRPLHPRDDHSCCQRHRKW